jgi:phytoene synthase
MSTLYDQVSEHTSRLVTKQYSTSFSLATKMLGANIRRDIYNIYGFVRLADEIVDTFLSFDNRALFDDFEAQLYRALDQQISLNPVLHAFQQTYHRNKIPLDYVKAFMNSMRADLDIKDYTSKEAYEQYIYGSADVVGLMCL